MRQGGSSKVGRAHPRSRGEHPLRMCSAVSPEGSSPLARGALDAPHAYRIPRGLIPARAGSTAFRDALHLRQWAHPRSRGEHVDKIHWITTGQGSSPLARGALEDRVEHVLEGGLIPARAGSTRTQSEIAALSRAHPRSRGEHTC